LYLERPDRFSRSKRPYYFATELPIDSNDLLHRLPHFVAVIQRVAEWVMALPLGEKVKHFLAAAVCEPIKASNSVRAGVLPTVNQNFINTS
jgi:hypothetical protein